MYRGCFVAVIYFLIFIPRSSICSSTTLRAQALISVAPFIFLALSVGGNALVSLTKPSIASSLTILATSTKKPLKPTISTMLLTKSFLGISLSTAVVSMPLALPIFTASSLNSRVDNLPSLFLIAFSFCSAKSFRSLKASSFLTTILLNKFSAAFSPLDNSLTTSPATGNSPACLTSIPF